MSEFIIRQANLKDLKPLTDLYEKLTRDQNTYDRVYQLVPKPDFQKLVNGFLSSGNNLFFLAEQAGRIVGFIRLNIYYGNNLQRLQSKGPEPIWKKFTPRRILRKALVLFLVWMERPFETPQIFQPLRAGYIADLFVETQARNQGIGTRLVKQALEWFKENQIDIVYLQALAENTIGVRFWEKQGFSTFRFAMRRKI